MLNGKCYAISTSPPDSGQKAEAKLVNSFHRERSQGPAEMRGREVASLPGESGLHMAQSQGRASPFLAKSVLSELRVKQCERLGLLRLESFCHA